MPEQQDRARFDLLRYAVWTNLDLAESLLAEDPSLVEARNGIGETVLHYIAVENGLKEVAWLIAHGADVNTKNDFEETPLIEAATLDHYKMCQLLLEHGANALMKDNTDGSAPFNAAQNVVSGSADTATLELILSHIIGHDINNFFDEIQLEMVHAHAHPDVLMVLSNHGLRAFARSDEPE
jgi:ankyrin repeat protein